jgi:NAD(P)-dependent dehydrogenase (short-subunit alcohol dehydrogenase family)
MKETSMSSERKIAVITGTSQGIGAALVEAYRDRDYGVVATARSIRPTSDDQILVVPGDITDRKTAERAISEGLARFGRIDTLINNAGIFVAKPFAQYTEADYAAALGVNLTGLFHITQLAIAEMEKRCSGHVVQITTSLIDHANSHVPSVLASLTKGGLSTATKTMAARVRPLNLDCGSRVARYFCADEEDRGVVDPMWHHYSGPDFGFPRGDARLRSICLSQAG